jgi:hypothetical protein
MRHSLLPQKLFLILIVWAAPLPTFGVNGDIDLLRLIVAERQANQSRLATWQGTATVVESEQSDGPGPQRQWEAEVAFVYDNARGGTRWNWQYKREAQITDDGQVINHPDPSYTSGMTINGSYFRYGNVRPKSGDTPNRVRIFADDAAKEDMFTDGFDPNWYFAHRGADPTKLMKMLVESARDPDTQGWHVRRDGSMVFLEFFDAGKNTPMNRYTFDLNCGGQMIGFDGVDSYVKESWVYTFENLAGVWVPSEVSYINHTKYDEEPDRHKTRTIRWTQHSVNELVPDGAFTLESMGVRPGDIVSDQRLNLQYEYKETQIESLASNNLDTFALMDAPPKNDTIETKSYPLLSTTTPQHPTDNMLIEILAVAVGVGLVGLAVLWTYRRKRAPSDSAR